MRKLIVSEFMSIDGVMLPSDVHSTFGLISAKAFPSGVVGLHYKRPR